MDAQPQTHRVTVVQLARFGDLVQTSPLLQRLRSQGADHITLVVDARMEPAAHLLRDVDHIVPVDIVQAARLASDEMASSMRRLRSWFREWRPANPTDRLLLLNRGDLPAAVGSLIPAREKYGPLPGSFGGVPHRLLVALLADRRFNPLHLADIWAGYAPGSAASNPPTLVMDGLGTGFAKYDCRRSPSRAPNGIYAVNVGAAAAGRRPGGAKLARLVEALLQRGAREAVLLGTEVDREDAQRCRSLVSPQRRSRVRDLTGQTTLTDLVEVIHGADALISADTGTLQLAAGTGTVPVGLFYGGANPVETGPYVEGALAITRRDTLEQDERTTRNGLEGLEMGAVAEIAVRRVGGEQKLTEPLDGTDDFTLLVAGPSPLGVGYGYAEGAKSAALGKGGRWLPYLRFLLHRIAPEGRPAGDASGDAEGFRRADERLQDIMAGRTITPIDDEEARELRWIAGVAAEFPRETMNWMQHRARDVHTTGVAHAHGIR